MKSEIMSGTFIVLSGCSGGGKSTLLAELARRGHRTVPEPGRRIVAKDLAGEGAALPWVDAAAFARRAIAMALADRAAVADVDAPVFFDRSLIDAVAALVHLGTDRGERALLDVHRYHRRVFLAPPWRDIFEGDRERRHSFEAAVAEYERLAAFYPETGYEVSILPRTTVRERADLVENYLEGFGLDVR